MTKKIKYNDVTADGALFPVDAPVLVRYPLPGADEADGDSWAWLPGSVIDECGPGEWSIVIEVSVLAEPDPSVSDAGPEDMLYPVCFRDASEIRAVSDEEWFKVHEELAHG
ncbi:hypothetical protein GCM10009555_015130 [Acrocarpospora macrocephala]|uniref:Uncharacterized protein n=1 Tax=Acrocarpospora macrocephala TaxID=150177 RepID=A0A5M3WYW2_9ACTN|nr:hypothetical protein [Acrocarpospora macrocephala]GES14154.1 hypothetical protein Amac_077510 [Acrocarpospora macrocephala]